MVPAEPVAVQRTEGLRRKVFTSWGRGLYDGANYLVSYGRRTP